MRKILCATAIAIGLLEPAFAAEHLSLIELPIPNFSLNGGFPHWKACRASVKSNSSDCTVLFIGESTFTGLGAFYGGHDMHSAAIPNQLGTILRSFGINAQNYSLTGDSNAVSYNSFDTRVTPNNWTASLIFTLGGKEWRATDGSPLVFNPTDPAYPSLAKVRTDSIDIYWNGVVSGGGIITIDTGGSPICSIDTNTGAKQFNKTTCTTTLGANAYNIRCLNAFNCTFNTLVARNSKVHEASILNGSANGATVVNFNADSGSPWDPLHAIEKVAPSLCIVMELANDGTKQTTIADFTKSLTAITNACKRAGADVLLMTGFPYGATVTPITIEQYQAAIKQVAASTNVAVWDTLKTWGQTSGPGETAWTSMGMNSGWNPGCCGQKADIAHWSVANNVYAATLIAMMLLQ